MKEHVFVVKIMGTAWFTETDSVEMECVDKVRWTNKLQVTTVFVEPCFSGCADDQDCQANQICGDNGRCRAGESRDAKAAL